MSRKVVEALSFLLRVLVIVVVMIGSIALARHSAGKK